MQSFDVFKVLALLSLRNLGTHKVKSMIVGGIMFFGTFLVVLGTSLLDSIERSMAKSITGSLAGHLQVYDAKARDQLAIFGGMSMGAEDIGRMTDFSAVKSALLEVPNVDAVIPMGIDFASVTRASELDSVLQNLRDEVRAGNVAAQKALGGQVRQIAKLIEAELKNTLAISSDKATVEKNLANLARVQSDALWTEFEATPIEVLEWLDTEIAPLSGDARLIYLRYIGTDVDAFAKNFDRFEVVDGQMIPPGNRGVLINKKFYEEYIKNRVASELDFIRRAIVEQEKTPESDGILKAKITQLPRQYQRITFQLKPDAAAKLEAELRGMFPEEKGDLEALVKRFLTVDASNIDARRTKFYELIAPMIRLYDLPIGETITLRGFTKSGYLKSVNIKVWGTFQFKGLERSEIAGGHNLIDVLTFRDLYGYMTEQRKKEIEEIRGEVGTKAVDRASAEAELFGGGGELVAEKKTEEGKGFDEFAKADLSNLTERAQAETAMTFTPDAIDKGVALNAAIILKDATKIRETAEAIKKVAEEKKLGIQVVDWQQAAGIVGQFVIVVRLVLFIAIAIIFTVALVIINNSMVTATMERTIEIGTMRAIGAQRRFILVMFLLETLVLGALAGGLGMLAAAGMVEWLGTVGIAAKMDVLVFLFAGPRLYPDFGLSNLVIGFVAILFVSLISTLYPARIATTIQPVVAMQRKE
ncbi:FtsX-like permease family protein [Myxococcota bacterium]|nr:FtsX-like permease family protein [Myxococcota bacterium]